MAKSRCCTCNVYLCHRSLAIHRARLSEASARTLLVLDVNGWKYQFDARNTNVKYSICEHFAHYDTKNIDN